MNSLHKEFDKIVENFKSEVAQFLETNNLDEYTVHIQLDENRPYVKICNLDSTIKKDFAVLQDANIHLVLPVDIAKSI